MAEFGKKVGYFTAGRSLGVRWAFAGRSLGVRWAFAGRSLVVSNNQDYEAGQSFTLTSGSGSAHVKIQAVKDGKLMLENRGKTGVITMKKS